MPKSKDVKTDKERTEMIRIVNRIDTTDGLTRVIKVGDKYFRVRELG